MSSQYSNYVVRDPFDDDITEPIFERLVQSFRPLNTPEEIYSNLGIHENLNHSPIRLPTEVNTSERISESRRRLQLIISRANERRRLRLSSRRRYILVLKMFI